MRILVLHVDYFSAVMTDRSRSKIIEEVNDKSVAVKEALVVLSSVEKNDEQDPDGVVRNAAKEISNLAAQLGVNTFVLHSFAHLFAELARPEIAIQVLRSLQQNLEAQGFSVCRTPFGWFNTLEFKAKGHPLSRVARIITP